MIAGMKRTRKSVSSLGATCAECTDLSLSLFVPTYPSGPWTNSGSIAGQDTASVWMPPTSTPIAESDLPLPACSNYLLASPKSQLHLRGLKDRPSPAESKLKESSEAANRRAGWQHPWTIEPLQHPKPHTVPTKVHRPEVRKLLLFYFYFFSTWS